MIQFYGGAAQKSNGGGQREPGRGLARPLPPRAIGMPGTVVPVCRCGHYSLLAALTCRTSNWRRTSSISGEVSV